MSKVSIRRDGVAHQCPNLTEPIHHGEQFRLWFRDVTDQYAATVWEPYERAEEVGPWIELINSVRGAAGPVPRAFVAG